MSDRPTALIVGAGIGGLAAGVALRRAGWNIRIHERAASPRELGFGLGLAPNALSALDELGVADPVVRAGAQLAKIEIRRTNGRVIRRLNVHVGVPAIVALRAEVHGALLVAVGEEPLRMSSEAVAFRETTHGVSVDFQDGSTDTGNMLIGADGVRSAIRECLHPNEPPPRPSGFSAIRGVAYGASHNLGELSGVGYLDHGIEAGTIRASSDAVYWYISLRSQDVVDPSPVAILNQRCANFEPALRAILQATKPDDMRFDRLFQRDALRAWGAGHVTLLGDAAHPLLPHTGQGAAQALEDAVALGLAVQGAGRIEQRLRRYETVRARRTRSFVRLGPRIARLTTTTNIVTKAVRSLALRMIPECLLALSAQHFQRDPHRELRSHAASVESAKILR